MGKSSKTRTKKAATKKTKAVSKGAKIIELLHRDGGATLADLTKATEWQPHSVRGFLSAQVSKKLGLKLQTAKGEDGRRVYQIVS